MGSPRSAENPNRLLQKFPVLGTISLRRNILPSRHAKLGCRRGEGMLHHPTLSARNFASQPDHGLSITTPARRILHREVGVFHEHRFAGGLVIGIEGTVTDKEKPVTIRRPCAGAVPNIRRIKQRAGGAPVQESLLRVALAPPHVIREPIPIGVPFKTILVLDKRSEVPECTPGGGHHKNGRICAETPIPPARGEKRAIRRPARGHRNPPVSQVGDFIGRPAGGANDVKAIAGDIGQLRSVGRPPGPPTMCLRLFP
mgnify:CR=1 FL=1